jgi:NAD/NADP octopine/nopaline dehydrogenase, alpha-helical domain
MPTKLEACICGGGHVAHALAAVLGANPDVALRILTRRPALWSPEVHGIHGGLVVVGRPKYITADAAVAVAGADLVLIAAPAFAHHDILTAIREFIAPHAWIGALPAPGFFDWAVADRPHRRIFGAQRSPYNCRVTRMGREVEIIGVVPRLAVAVSPRDAAAELLALLGTALSLPIDPLDNFLCATLAPSPTIFHPARMYSLLKDWDGTQSFDHVPLLYEHWDDAASEVYLRCDSELQAVCQRMPLEMSGVAPAVTYYNAGTPAALTSRIRALAGLRGIAMPMRNVGGRNLPDLCSRFFLEDFPFGMEAVRTVAALAGVETPMLDALDAWSRSPPIAGAGRPVGCSSRIVGRSLDELVRRASI